MIPSVQKEIVGVNICVFLIIMINLSKYVYTYYVYNKLDLYTPNYIDVENSRNALQSNFIRIIYVRIICHNQGFELDGFTYFLVAIQNLIRHKFISKYIQLKSKNVCCICLHILPELSDFACLIRFYMLIHIMQVNQQKKILNTN